LFVAYAPAEDPTIALAVVVEHGGHGGSDAAPVARRVLEAYFDLPVKERNKARPGPLAGHLDPVEAAAAAALAAAQKKAATAGAEQAASKPEQKKLEPKKPEKKKPEQKKPEQKKPEKKKPEQKKPEAGARQAPKPFVPDSGDPATDPATYRGRGR